MTIPDGTTAMQVSCPQDRLPCFDYALERAMSLTNETGAKLAYVERLEAQLQVDNNRIAAAEDKAERLEADNLSLRGVLRDLVNAHPRCGKCGQLNAAEINLCCLTRRVLGAPELAPALRAALEALKP